jgi:hypothetical protein
VRRRPGASVVQPQQTNAAGRRVFGPAAPRRVRGRSRALVAEGGRVTLVGGDGLVPSQGMAPAPHESGDPPTGVLPHETGIAGRYETPDMSDAFHGGSDAPEAQLRPPDPAGSPR